MSTLSEFYEGGPKTWNEAFPPVCIKPRYDSTLVADHVLPKFQHNMVFDPRPSTRVCYIYHTTNPENPSKKQSEAPIDLSAYPPGGAAGKGFPFEQYQKSVEAESDLFRLDEHLTRCKEKRYIPSDDFEQRFVGRNEIPGTNYDSTQSLSPLATFVTKEAGCRNEDDKEAWNRSSRLFFNPTRYDRTTSVPSSLKKPESQYSLACGK